MPTWCFCCSYRAFFLGLIFCGSFYFKFFLLYIYIWFIFIAGAGYGRRMWGRTGEDILMQVGILIGGAWECGFACFGQLEILLYCWVELSKKMMTSRVGGHWPMGLGDFAVTWVGNTRSHTLPYTNWMLLKFGWSLRDCISQRLRAPVTTKD